MYTLYAVAMPQAIMTKIKDHDSYGQLKKFMNNMKTANKSILYVIYQGNILKTSMLNK
jgi:hypothetical protein